MPGTNQTKFYKHIDANRRIPGKSDIVSVQKTLNDIANRRTNLHHLHSNIERIPENFLDNNYLNVLDLQVSLNDDIPFIDYTTPDITNNDTSNNFYNAVTYQSIDVSNTSLVINKLFLRTHPHNDNNNPRILVNRILYLSLDNDSGYLIKRSDDVSNQSIRLFKSGYDSYGKLDNRQLSSMDLLATISFENISIINNFNNLFPLYILKSISAFNWPSGNQNNVTDLSNLIFDGTNRVIVKTFNRGATPNLTESDVDRILDSHILIKDSTETIGSDTQWNTDPLKDTLRLLLRIQKMTSDNPNSISNEWIDWIVDKNNHRDDLSQNDLIISKNFRLRNLFILKDSTDTYGLFTSYMGTDDAGIVNNTGEVAELWKSNDPDLNGNLTGNRDEMKQHLLNIQQLDHPSNASTFWVTIEPNPVYYDVYTHLGVGAHNVIQENNFETVNQVTTYLNSYGQEVILPNRGVESMPIKDDNMRRLIHMDTPNPFAKNLLYTVFDASSAINGIDTSSNPNIDFNVRNWLVAEEDLAPPRGNQVGQFVFTDDASGEMAYQYFYDRDLSDITIGKKMPYTVFFNITGGKLKFSEQEYQKFAFTGPNIDISSIASAADISNSSLFDLSGLDLNDNAMPSDFSTNFLVFKESYEYRYLAEIAATYFKSNNKFYYKVDGTEPDLSFHYVEWNDNNLNYGSVHQNSDVSLSIIPTHRFFFSGTSKYNDSNIKPDLDRFYRHANRMIFANPPDLSSTLFFAYPDYDNTTSAAPTYIAVTTDISSADFENNTFIRTLVGIDQSESNFTNIRSIIVGKDKILGYKLGQSGERKIVNTEKIEYNNIAQLENLESLNLRHLTIIDKLGDKDGGIGEDVSHISTLVIPRTVNSISNPDLLNDNITLNNLIFLNDVSGVSGIDISMILTDISGRVNTVYFLHPNVNSQTPNIVNDEQGIMIDTGNMKRLFSIPYNNNILKYE